MGQQESTLFREIDDLNQQAFDFRVSDSHRALALSQEIVERCRAMEYTKGLAYALRTMGFCLMRLSKNKEALPFLDEAIFLFDALGEGFGMSHALATYGIIHRNFGQYKQSLERLYQSLELIQPGEEESLSWYHIGVTYKYMGNLEKALECLLKSLSIAKLTNSIIAESYSLNTIGGIYFELKDYSQALDYYLQSLSLRKQLGDKWGEAGSLDNIGYTHFKLGNGDLGTDFCKQSLTIAEAIGDKKGQGNSLFHLAEINLANSYHSDALDYANKSLVIRQELNDQKGQAEVFLCLSNISNKADTNSTQQLDFLNQALELGQKTKALDLLYRVHDALFLKFKSTGNFEKALLHLEASTRIEKEIHTAAINQKIQALEIENRIEQSKRETEIYRLKNVELATLNAETIRQKEEIEKTLDQLKSTQSQLIQSEKMASLGELTAGIAHEIQNPLNFVNNFSEVSKELLEEMRVAMKKRDTEDAQEIMNALIQNLEKINHHGKRADAIVKSMLQHSRKSSGQKEVTDINALCDEYLRLAYHGYRAKDKSFNAKFETQFDESLPKANVVAQDIGRVILNLINNAFYAVNEKAKLEPPTSSFQPQVTVSTKNLGDKVEIRVSDNGPGIPEKVKEKIFHPFFTTKPTGQGTGLGLSLSYDIVKAHGGELKVDTKEGEGSEFIIQVRTN